MAKHQKQRSSEPQEVHCPYCSGLAEYVDSEVVYGKSYGMIYLCKCLPGWAYVGCHPGSAEPLGRLADRELREWKKKAHAAFDPLWKERQMYRWQAYKWLSKRMGLPEEKAHIGMFDVEQCKKVVVICEKEREKMAQRLERARHLHNCPSE